MLGQDILYPKDAIRPVLKISSVLGQDLKDNSNQDAKQ